MDDFWGAVAAVALCMVGFLRAIAVLRKR